MSRPSKRIANADTKHILATNLLALLKHHGLSQNALAKRCTVSQKQINNLVRAQTESCGLDVLVELAGALQVAPWLLLHPDAPKVIGRSNRLARLVDDYVMAGEPDPP